MQNNFNSYYLKFTTPLHIGDYKPESYEKSESFLRSDTIMAAIFSAWAKIGKVDWIGDGVPPFTISSAFPYFQKEEKKVLFFPRIKKQFNILIDNDLSKPLKKIVWIDSHFFEKIINDENIADIQSSIQGDFLTAIELPKNGFMIRQISERVQIPRDSTENESEPFYMERIYFNDGGLFFLATGDEFEKLESALDFLAHEGFGTDRNVGNGFFKWSKEWITLNAPDSEYGTNLSLYCPESKEKVNDQVDEKSTYDLIKRGGWITTEGYQGKEKNSVYMFTEGSVFYKPDDIDGNPNIDLSPDILKSIHKIYRCGRSIFLPVKI